MTLDETLAQKNALLMELESLKRTKGAGRKVLDVASRVASLEVTLALSRLEASPEDSAINLVSAASCLVDAKRNVEARRLLDRALPLAGAKFRTWIEQQIGVIGPETRQPGAVFAWPTNIAKNEKLRRPQVGAYIAAKQHFNRSHAHAIIQLPVGCGKTGTMALLPFALAGGRTLAIAPNLEIARNLAENFDYTSKKSFLRQCSVLANGKGPTSALLSAEANVHDADGADYVITNIQQLVARDAKKWLGRFAPDYFQLILVDEGHHNVADSWRKTFEHFSTARVVSFTATPLRSDGKKVEGQPIYRFPIKDAIVEGYVRDLASRKLEPVTLAFVYQGSEHRHTLEEVLKLREEDWFSRGVALAPECNAHIVDASIQCVEELRAGSQLKHQIIAAACSIDHARSIRSMYEARGYAAEVIHSQLPEAEQEAVRAKLKNNQLDAIVHVQMLAEGADYPMLGVAAIFRPFRHLVPYVQFVGRVMRVPIQNAPGHPDNRGFVVTHIGLNVDRWWQDLRSLDAGDQLFFEQLANSDLEFTNPPEQGGDEPGPRRRFKPLMEVLREEVNHFVHERFLPEDKAAVVEDLVQALTLRGFNLEELGITREQLARHLDEEGAVQRGQLVSQDVQPQRARQEARRRLNERVRSAAKELLNELKLPIGGHKLLRAAPQSGATNNLTCAVVLINLQVAEYLGVSSNERDLLTFEQLEKAYNEIDAIVDATVAKVRIAMGEKE
ncbi:MAG TPA: DEAD/DEAH box helicase family protein [Polyangiaceae bacterium]|nr:DEAD/DEAH box helicase family protein [Polyangiaceae bacterium]